MSKEQIFPNGLGLAKVIKLIDEDTMVKLVLHHSRDQSSNWDYNLTYQVENEFTDDVYSFDSIHVEYYKIKERFDKEVEYNKEMIEKVKKFLNYEK